MLRLRPQTSCAALPLAVVALLGQVAAAQDSDSGGKSAVTTIIEYSASVLLVCFSGLFSGLTLGLMGLDLSGLEVRAAARAVGRNGSPGGGLHPRSRLVFPHPLRRPPPAPPERAHRS